MIAFTPGRPGVADDRARNRARRLPLQPAVPRRRGAGPRRPQRQRRRSSRASATPLARGQGRLHRRQLLLPRPRDRPRPRRSARRSRCSTSCPRNDVPDARSDPTRPPCPTTCTEFGWEIYPAGLSGGARDRRWLRPARSTSPRTAWPTPTTTSARAYLLGHLRAAARGDAGQRGASARLLPLVAGRQLRVGRRLHPRFGFYSLRPGDARAHARARADAASGASPARAPCPR